MISDALKAALQSKNPQIQQEVIEALSKIEDRESLELLLAALRDSDISVQRAAIEAILRAIENSQLKPFSFIHFAGHGDSGSRIVMGMTHSGRTASYQVLRKDATFTPWLFPGRETPNYWEEFEAKPGAIGWRRHDEFVSPNQRPTTCVALEFPRRDSLIKRIYVLFDDQSRQETKMPSDYAFSEDVRDMLLREALASARKIENDQERAKMLIELINYSPANQRDSLACEALSAARRIRNAQQRVSMLPMLIQYLPASQRQSALREAMTTAQQIKNAQKRAQSFVSIIRLLSNPETLESFVATLGSYEVRNDWGQRWTTALGQEMFNEWSQVEANEIQLLGVRVVERLLGSGSVAEEGSAAASQQGGEVEGNKTTDDNLYALESPSAEMYAVAQVEGHQAGASFVIDKEYKLLAGVLRNIPAGFEGAPVQLPDLDVVEIDVIVRSVGIDFLPHWAQKVRFFRGRDSGLAEFKLIPREIGHKRIDVEFYYQRHWLTCVVFEVEVIESEEPAM